MNKQAKNLSTKLVFTFITAVAMASFFTVLFVSLLDAPVWGATSFGLVMSKLIIDP